ncbi:hypothetical protein PT974_07232 [Cladobotryum mycophilum]|uniref:NACHT-NTPase and P-loop NTPases N-terminal domain-containing protein n=1 Tax=Cladobotryum mycophilum TaxID=491253 RepID=A0ABR0SPW3_9HYPO
MTATKASDPISGTIAVVQAAISHYDIVKDDTKLGETFHEAGRGLILIEDALRTTGAQLRALTEIPQATTTSLESCNAGATLSEVVFKEVSQAPADTRLHSYTAFVERKGRANLVETLVVGMMDDIRVLAKDCAIEAEMQEQLTMLRGTIDKLTNMEPSVPIKQASHSFSNFGPGSQYNAIGGTQNNVTGNGKQFIGSNFNAAVTFS